MSSRDTNTGLRSDPESIELQELKSRGSGRAAYNKKIHVWSDGSATSDVAVPGSSRINKVNDHNAHTRDLSSAQTALDTLRRYHDMLTPTSQGLQADETIVKSWLESGGADDPPSRWPPKPVVKFLRDARDKSEDTAVKAAAALVMKGCRSK
jgi:hypothetical protein